VIPLFATPTWSDFSKRNFNKDTAGTFTFFPRVRTCLPTPAPVPAAADILGGLLPFVLTDATPLFVTHGSIIRCPLTYHRAHPIPAVKPMHVSYTS
jgi:hypothetical protein